MDARPKIALLVVALGALPGAAAATHRPGHGQGPGNLTLAAAPSTVVFGKPVALSGKLSGRNAGGRTIQVQADTPPFDNDFENVGTATTDAQGQYAFTHRPVENTRYRARQGNTISGFVTVLVRIRVSLRPSDATPRSGARVRFAGRGCPKHDGAAVRLQRRTRVGGWRTVRSTVLADIPGSTCSRYATSARVRRDGRYRAVVAGDADHARGISRSRRIDVHG